jgi:hypothetical protein
VYKQLTIDTKSFTSTQNIAEDAMKHKKLTKVTSGYLEIENFVNSDTHTGYLL